MGFRVHEGNNNESMRARALIVIARVYSKTHTACRWRGLTDL